MRRLRLRPLPRPAGAAAALAISLLAAGGARASGLDSPMIGSGQSGPTTVDPAAVYWNPAQLAFIRRPDVLAGAGVVIGSVGYQRDRLGTYQTPDTLVFRRPLPPANIDPAKTGPAPGVTATPVAPIGDLFFATPLIPDRLVMGAGVYVPYAAAISFPDSGPQRFQIREALLTAANVTASAAVRLSDRMSVGAGISYVLGFAELARLQDFAAVEDLAHALETLGQKNDFGPDAPSDVRELDTLARPFSLKRAFSHGVTFNVGLALRPTDELDVAFTYQHGASMHYKGRFALDMSDDFFTRDLAPHGLRYKPLVTGDGELSFSLPKRLTVGVGYQVSPRLRVDGFVSYIFYSELEAFVVEVSSPDLAQPKLGIPDRVKVVLPRRWNNTVWIEANGRLRITKKLLVSGTLGYQSPASPDETIDASSPDGHRIIVGTGGVLDVSKKVSLLGDLRFQQTVPRHVTDSEHDLANGTYRLFVATGMGHLRVRF